MSFWKTAGQAIAGSAGGIGMGLVSGLFGLGANRKRAQESEKQRKWSESMWERQNAYNTPENQMKRLKQAGLNPALMYGQGTTGNAEKALPYQQAQIENLGPAIAQSAAAGAQIDLTRNLAAKAKAEKNNIEAGTLLTNEQTQKTIADRLNIDAQKAKTIQETLNLKTEGEVLEFTKAIKALELARGKKGTLKGDALGNLFEVLNLDPKNSESDRALITGALTAYFGSKVAKDLMQGISSLRWPFGNKTPKAPTRSYGNSNEFNYMNYYYNK